ncbi:hypothetical protein [Nocardia sp. NPDC127526]|uniref:hypothetical protein n=1 Tax=Nocardia sp. NPDC127526 TaxID=3345393 RepID=UPI0036372D53
MITRRTTAPVLLAAGLLGAAAACSNSTEPTSPGTTLTDGTAVITTPGGPTISLDAANQLCDMMRPEISTWSEQGPQLGKVAFNGTVHNWALRNNGINAAILQDRAVVDTATLTACPDVRQEALQVLRIGSLAEGLAGF